MPEDIREIRGDGLAERTTDQDAIHTGIAAHEGHTKMNQQVSS